MAELGSIKTTDINRGVYPARSTLPEAINTTLNVGTKIIGEAVEAKVAGEVNAEIDAILAAEGAPEVIDPRGRGTLEEGTNQEIPLVMAEIDMLNQRILQGKGSKVDAAKLDLQTLIARHSNSPFAAQIAARAGQEIDQSGVLHKLALEDAAQATKAAQAQSHLDDITARWTVLGVPIEQLGTEQGSKEYTKRSNRQSKIDANTQELALIIGTRELDTQQALQSWTKNVNSEYGAAARQISVLMDRPGGYNAVVRELDKSPELRNNALIDTWLTSGRAEDAQAFARVQLGIEQVGGEIFRKDPGARTTKAGQAMLAQTTDIVSQLARAGELFTSEKAPTPSALQLGKMEQEWRVMALFNKAQPAVRQFNDMISSTYVNGENFLKVMPLIVGGEAVISKDALGRVAGGAINALIPGYTQTDPLSGTERATLHMAAGGEGQITPTMGADQVNTTLRGTLMQREKTLIVDTTSEDELAGEAHAQANEAQRIFNGVKQVNELSTPTFAAKTLTNMNEAFQVLVMTGRFNEGQVDWIKDTLASDDMFEAIAKAGDAEGAQRRLAFGVTATDLYALTKPGEARRAALADYNSRADNGILKNFVQFDDDAIAKMRDEGVVTYTFNEPRIEAAARAQLAPGDVALTAGGPTLDSAMTALRERVRARMDRIVGFANKDIRTEAHIAAAKAPSVTGLKPQYTMKVNQLGWLDGFFN